MAMNFDVDTSDMVPMHRSVPRAMPPLELTPLKSPFYVGQLPSTANVNPDQIRNFATPGIPNFRITPAAPLNVASTANRVPTAAKLPVLMQTTPAPTISQPLATIPTGYQFSFLQIRLPLSSTIAISTYKVYRNTVNSSASAVAIQSIPHHAANSGVPVVVQDAQPNGLTQFYWVSAINMSGVESNLTPAQSGTVANNSGFNSNSQLASSLNNNPSNTSFAPLLGTTLGNSGILSFIDVFSNPIRLGSGVVFYNSGSLAPGGFGTFYVFVDDPTFSGGALPFLFNTQAVFQLFSDARIPYGKITTASGGTGSTGGGFTGGTTQISNPAVSLVGTRGIAQ